MSASLLLVRLIGREDEVWPDLDGEHGSLLQELFGQASPGREHQRLPINTRTASDVKHSTETAFWLRSAYMALE